MRRSILCRYLIFLTLGSALFLSDLAFLYGAAHLSQKKGLTLITLTDFHGALKSKLVRTKAGETVKVGGAALLADYVNTIKAKSNGPVLIVDGGDLFQGSMASNHFEGEPVVKFYNYLGVRATAIGNHEFDYGPLGPKPIAFDPEDDSLSALKKNVKMAKFAFLGVNLFKKDDQNGLVRPDWAKPSILFKFGGIKVGVIGAATEETPDSTLKQNIRDLVFQDPLPHIIKEANALRQKGAELIVLTIHDGGGCEENGNSQQYDLSSCDENSRLFQIVRGIPQKLIDVVVGGHTHKEVFKVVNGMTIMQPLAKGIHIGVAEVALNKSHKIAIELGEPISICDKVAVIDNIRTCNPLALKEFNGNLEANTFLGRTVKEDARVTKLLADYFNVVSEKIAKPVNINIIDDITRSYYGENALGNLLTDTFRDYINGKLDTKLDAVVMNNGGIRSNFVKGPLTYGDIYSAQPFDNYPSIFSLEGSELRKMVELTGELKKFSWSGLTYKVTVRGSVEEVIVGQNSLEDSKIYFIGTNNYLASGGSDFYKLQIPDKKIVILYNLPVLRDITFEQLKKTGKDCSPLDYFNPEIPRQEFPLLQPLFNP